MTKAKYRELHEGDIRQAGDQSRANPKHLVEPTISPDASEPAKESHAIRHKEYEAKTATWMRRDDLSKCDDNGSPELGALIQSMYAERS